MREFFKKLKERMYKKAIRDFSCCQWSDGKPLKQEEVEKLIKEIKRDRD